MWKINLFPQFSFTYAERGTIVNTIFLRSLGQRPGSVVESRQSWSRYINAYRMETRNRITPGGVRMQYYHLEMSGRLTIGDGDVRLRRQVDQALNRGYQVIIIDLSDVTYMDSAAVGQLAHSFKAITARGGKLALVGLRPKVRKLLQVMSFLDIFNVFDSLEDAVQIMEMHYRKQREARNHLDKIAV